MLERSRLYRQVVDQIRNQIATSVLQPGEKLPGEHDLARHFGVSRTVIREAMKTLAENGLVEVRAGEGTFIIDGTTSALKQSLTLMMSFGGERRLKDIVDLREMLEPEIAFKAALHATPDDINRLQRALRAMDLNLAAIKPYIVADNQFHLALAIATRNELLPRVLESVTGALTELREQIGRVKDAPLRGQVHHKLLLETIIQRDAKRARTVMINHLRQVRDDVTQALQELTERVHQ